MGKFLHGIATLAVIAGALIGLAGETTFIFAKFAESWTAMQTARVAKDTRRSMADIKLEEVHIQTAEAAVAQQMREAEAQEAEQQSITTRAVANAAIKLKAAEAEIAEVGASMNATKLKYFIDNQRAEITALYRNNSLLRYKVKDCFKLYDDYEDASTHTPILIERPLKGAAQ